MAKVSVKVEPTPITRKVDARGRVSLPDELANSHIIITKNPDGTYILEQLELVPKSTSWFWKNNKAQAMVSRGLKDIEEGNISDFDPAKEDLSWLKKTKEE